MRMSRDNEYEDHTGAIVVLRTHKFSEEEFSKELKSRLDLIKFYTEHKANGGVVIKVKDGTMKFTTFPYCDPESCDSSIANIKKDIEELKTFGRYLSRDEIALHKIGYVVRMDNTTEEDINEYGMVDPAIADPSIGKVLVNIDPITGNKFARTPSNDYRFL